MRFRPRLTLIATSLVLVVSMLLPLLAQAGIRTVPISMSRDLYTLGINMSYAEDKDSSLAFYDILLGLEQPNWRAVDEDVANFGYTKSTYWFALDLRNVDAERSDWFLEIAYPVLDDIDIYVTQDVHVLQQYRTGDHLPFTSRLVVHRNFVLPLSLDPQDELRIYIRVHTGTSMQVPVNLWSPTAFYTHDHDVTLSQGIYFGFMLVMALYNLFLYFSIRRRSYLFYVCFILSFSMFQFCIGGFAFQHLWPENVTLNEIALPFSLGCTLMFMSLFIRDFLELYRHSRWGYYLLNLTAIYALGVLIGCFYLSYYILIHALIFVAIPINLVGILFGIQRSLARDRAAQYFTLAWSATLVGALVLSLNKLDLMPRNVFTENALQIGTAIEVVLISFALGEYINQQRQARFQAQQESLRMEQVARLAQEDALASQKKYSSQLEQQVSERTEALNQVLQQLEQANRRLEHQNHIDDLTGVFNRRYFNEKYDAEFRRACREQSWVSVLMFDIDFFKKLNDSHGHLAGDQCLRTVAAKLQETLHRPADTLARYGGEEFIALLPNTPHKGAAIVAERCRAVIEKLRIDYHGVQMQLTLSIGVASIIPDHQLTPQELISAADAALYAAKESGRNRVCSAQLNDVTAG